MLTAKDIMTVHVEKVRAAAPLMAVVRLFTEKNLSAAIVTDDKGNATGVITKTDLVRHELERGGLTVGEWMTPVIMSATSDKLVTDIARQMVAYGIHHVFIREHSGGPILGVVSSFDILRSVGRLEPAPAA